MNTLSPNSSLICSREWGSDRVSYGVPKYWGLFRIAAQSSLVVGKDDEIQKAVNRTVFFTKKIKKNFCLYQIFLLDGYYGVLEGNRFTKALLQIQEKQ
ncbi:MAG: hypothetical protein P8Z73_03265, partial [Desulfobacteraceae bacterium]